MSMKYSIITINYNNSNGLRNTIESVVNQSYSDYEYIVIDGNSTDDSIKVIQKFANNIDIWISEPDKGIYNAMNKGIDHAHGDYLCFMNSGDCFYDQNVLQNVTSLLTSDICAGNIYERGNITGFPGSNITLMDLFHTTICQQALFIRRELNTRFHYDERFTIVSDWKFLIQSLIISNCTFRKIDVTICNYEGGGRSEQYHDILVKEKEEIITELLPPRILADYYYYKEKSSPILDLIPRFNKTWRLHRSIVSLVNLITILYQKIYGGNCKQKDTF